MPGFCDFDIAKTSPKQQKKWRRIGCRFVPVFWGVLVLKKEGFELLDKYYRSVGMYVHSKQWKWEVGVLMRTTQGSGEVSSGWNARLLEEVEEKEETKGREPRTCLATGTGISAC